MMGSTVSKCKKQHISVNYTLMMAPSHIKHFDRVLTDFLCNFSQVEDFDEREESFHMTNILVFISADQLVNMLAMESG